MFVEMIVVVIAADAVAQVGQGQILTFVLDLRNSLEVLVDEVEDLELRQSKSRDGLRMEWEQYFEEELRLGV